MGFNISILVESMFIFNIAWKKIIIWKNFIYQKYLKKTLIKENKTIDTFYFWLLLILNYSIKI